MTSQAQPRPPGVPLPDEARERIAEWSEEPITAVEVVARPVYLIDGVERPRRWVETLEADAEFLRKLGIEVDASVEFDIGEVR